MSLTIAQHLNRQIANWSVLYVKLHHYHWYVKGTQFFELHEKFQEYYEEAAGYVDELAERLLAIGGQPVSTMKAYLEQSNIQEAEGEETAKEMVDRLIQDFELLIGQLKEGMDAADVADDVITSDLFLAIRSSLEKHVWMLRAFNA